MKKMTLNVRLLLLKFWRTNELHSYVILDQTMISCDLCVTLKPVFHILVMYVPPSATKLFFCFPKNSKVWPDFPSGFFEQVCFLFAIYLPTDTIDSKTVYVKSNQKTVGIPSVCIYPSHDAHYYHKLFFFKMNKWDDFVSSNYCAWGMLHYEISWSY